MKTRWVLSRSLTAVTVVLLAVTGSLVGCAGKTAKEAPSDEVVPVISRASDAVVAEASVVPALWVELRLDTAGEVREVLVAEGDRVAANAALLRLDTGQLELSLQSAQQDVIAQRLALAQLIRGASEAVIARADKGNTDQIIQAEIALRAKELQLEQAQADDPAANVTSARARVKAVTVAAGPDARPGLAGERYGCPDRA